MNLQCSVLMNKVELFENERAANYNQFVETWIPNYYYFLDLLPKLLIKASPKELLVVGCGTGNEIERFVETAHQWKITGIDPSPEMMKQARDKLQACENVTLIEGLVSELSVDKKYSAATLLLVLHFMDDNGSKLKLLKDIGDRLLSGGAFIMLDITGDKNQISQNLSVLRFLLPDALDEEEINSRLNRIENKLFAVSEQRLSELLQEAGFEPPLRFFQSSIYMGWLAKKK